MAETDPQNSGSDASFKAGIWELELTQTCCKIECQLVLTTLWQLVRKIFAIHICVFSLVEEFGLIFLVTDSRINTSRNKNLSIIINDI